jgi:hypothetical protein
MTIQIILFILGGLIFLFSFWRRLKEDYFENQIFTTGFYIFVFVLLGNLISKYFLPSYWFWSSLLGILIGISLSTLRYKMRFFENLEAAVGASFIPVILILLYDGIRERHAHSFFAIAGIALLFGLYYFLRTHYKRISWYKSGRIGFAGVCVLILFFLLRALLAVWFPAMVSFVIYEWIVSASATILSLGALIYLTHKTS